MKSRVWLRTRTTTTYAWPQKHPNTERHELYTELTFSVQELSLTHVVASVLTNTFLFPHIRFLGGGQLSVPLVPLILMDMKTNELFHNIELISMSFCSETG